MGSIPILSDVIETIRDIISWTIGAMPPFMKVLLLVLMVTSVGALFQTTFLGMIGYHCDYDNQLYKVSGFSLLGNIDLLRMKPTPEEFNVSGIEINWLCLQNSESGPRGYAGQRCTNCPNDGKVCTGDGERIDWGWYIGWYCGMLGCAPPEYFKYDHVGLGSGNYQYVCYDDSTGACTRFAEKNNNQKIKDEYTRRILDNNAEEVNYDYSAITSLSSVRCFNDEPKWVMFGIQILNPIMWVFLFILTFAISFFFKHK